MESSLDNLKNGVIVYYQDGCFKVGEVKDGVWTNRQSNWIGKLNPNKMLEINLNYKDYVVIGPTIKKENKMEWFNFKTGSFEMGGGPQTDGEALQYIPDIPAAQGLFQVHRLMGKSIEEAMIETLTSCVGDKSPKPKKWWRFWGNK